MNKFETTLLQTLSSIDESLKTLATANKSAARKAKKPNGALPKAAAKAARALEKGKAAVVEAKGA